MPPEKIEHASWPAPGEHLFTEWRAKTAMPHAILYRVCIHPDCRHIEEKPAPNC